VSVSLDASDRGPEVVALLGRPIQRLSRYSDWETLANTFGCDGAIGAGTECFDVAPNLYNTTGERQQVGESRQHIKTNFESQPKFSPRLGRAPPKNADSAVGIEDPVPHIALPLEM
jgi:hypothetical protein